MPSPDPRASGKTRPLFRFLPKLRLRRRFDQKPVRDIITHGRTRNWGLFLENGGQAPSSGFQMLDGRPLFNRNNPLLRGLAVRHHQAARQTCRFNNNL